LRVAQFSKQHDFVGDQAHLLNQANAASDQRWCLDYGGEPFAPGTRMEYTDEFVVDMTRI